MVDCFQPLRDKRQWIAQLGVEAQHQFTILPLPTWKASFSFNRYLQTTSITQNADYEVILVDRIADIELQHLEKKACTLSTDCCLSTQGLILGGLLQKLADIVVNRMSGPVGDAEEMLEQSVAKRAKGQDVIFRIVVPSRQIGKVIGKEGCRIQRIREETKATIKIADAITRHEERVIIISSKDNDDKVTDAENALQQIANLILKVNMVLIEDTGLLLT